MGNDRLMALFVVLSTSLWGCHWKDGNRLESKQNAAAIDRSKLCKDGGAELNNASNECVCPDAARWSGLRCEPAGGDLPSAASLGGAEGSAAGPATEGADDAKKVAVEPSPPAATVAEPVPAIDTARLKTMCRRAHGDWLAEDAYCLCPNGQVLVGPHCFELSLTMVDDACQRAVHPGKFRQGHCECEPGLVFAPARGGCVPPYAGPGTAALRRTCESSLNRGRWSARVGVCQCPEGRIWRDEQCQVRERLTSRMVCESALYGGRWVGALRRCECPVANGVDQVWVDQSCKPAASLSEKVACAAESNGGQWSDKLERCVCPGSLVWHAKRRLCE